MFNFFFYALRLFRAVLVYILSAACVGSLQPAKPDATYAMTDKAEQYAARARILAASTEANFYDKWSGMLHNNTRNRFTPAGCWDGTALLTMYTKLTALDAKRVKDADRAIYTLDFYGRKTPGGGFSAYTGTWNFRRNNVTEGEVFYDDNMWVGRDLTELYCITKDKKYLSRAIVIADMLIAEGWVDLDEAMFTARFGRAPGGPLGGFYWKDNREALHACSNGPAIQFLTNLSQVTDNGKGSVYLDYAQKSYRFLRYLENDRGVFWDLMRFHKDEENQITGIDKRDGANWSYNSGTPISSAAALYRVTGEAAYLDDAIRWGRSADAFFPRQSAVPGVMTFTDLPWFREILLMGYIDLYEYDRDALGYIQKMEAAINYGYEHNRLNGILGIYNKNVISKDWVGGFQDDAEKQTATLRDQLPCAGIYASLAKFYALS